MRQRRRQPASPPASVAAAWRGVGVGVGTGAGVGRPMELGVRPPTHGTRDARRTAPPKYRAPPPKHRTRHPARATHACTAALGYDASQCWEVQRGAPRGGGARSGGSVRSWLCQAAAASPLSAPYQCSTGCALVGAATPGTRIIPVGLGMFRAGDLWLSKSTATARRTYLARRRARAGAVVWRGARGARQRRKFSRVITKGTETPRDIGADIEKPPSRSPRRRPGTGGCAYRASTTSLPHEDHTSTRVTGARGQNGRLCA